MGIFKVGQLGGELQYAPVKDTLVARLVAIATYYAITVATMQTLLRVSFTLTVWLHRPLFW